MTTLKTLSLSRCDFQVLATREAIKAAGLEVITSYDEELEEEYLTGYYIIKNGKSHYCPGAFPLLSIVV